MKEYLIKYPRMFIDLLAVLTSFILIIVLINIFGLNIYAKEIESWNSESPQYHTGNVFGDDGASPVSADALVDPLYYDTQHYLDLVSDGDSNITYYSNYKNDNDIAPTCTYYDPTYVSGGNIKDLIFDLNNEKFLLFGSPSGVIYGIFFHLTSSDQKLYLFNGIIMSDQRFYCYRISYTSGGLFGTVSNLNSSISSYNNGQYYYWNIGRSDITSVKKTFYNANFPMFFGSTSLVYSDFFTYFDDDNLISALGDKSLIQYNADSYPAFESGGESSDNNLYLEKAGFNFRINSPVNYDGSKSNPNFEYYYLLNANQNYGYIDFNYTPTDYQIQHPEQFTFRFNYTLLMRFKAKQYSLNDNANGGWYSFVIDGAYNSNVPFTSSDLINNQYTISTDDLFTDMQCSVKSAPTWFNFTGGSVKALIAQLSEIDYFWFDTSNPTRNYSWNLLCKCTIVNSDSISSIGQWQENYSFVTKQDYLDDNTLTYNYDPYVPEEDMDITTDVDSDNSYEVVDTNGNVQLINYDNDNNNQSVVIESTDPSFINSLIDRLIPVNGSSGGLTQRFTDLVNMNGWAVVVGQVYQIFPPTFVDLLMTYFTTIIGILCVAFVFWVILQIF